MCSGRRYNHGADLSLTQLITEVEKGFIQAKLRVDPTAQAKQLERVINHVRQNNGCPYGVSSKQVSNRVGASRSETKVRPVQDSQTSQGGRQEAGHAEVERR